MDEIKAKQQVVEKIKEASKILVTVSDDPSVDALSAALGLTLIFDKQEKYATAIFSGETPPAIAFLEPEKTFDDTTDSLRDFIIALNKEKADHLRYKIEGESVKIFITPYKTTINQDDLEFSQGDYNVELVIALGVSDQDHLDKALENHGQILHDATIITMTAGDQTSSLGGIDWHDANASSLSEMVAGLTEALKEDKKKTLVDAPIATALLTGIVAQTDRFSNEHTSSKVMTVAATLMVAGADQQLIANEIQQARSIEVENAFAEPEDKDDTPEDDAPEDTPEEDGPSEEMPAEENDPTRLSITHEDETLAELDDRFRNEDETLASLDERVRGEDASQDKIQDEIEAIEEEAKQQAEKREQDVYEAATQKPEIQPEVEPRFDARADEKLGDEPTFGGALNATTDEAEEQARRALEEDQNKTILDHAQIGEPVVEPAPEEAYSAYAPAEESQDGAINGERIIEPLPAPEVPVYAPESQPTPAAPADFGLPLPPPVPDFSQGLAAVVPPSVPFPEAPAQTAPAPILGDILNSEPAPQPAPAYGFEYETTNAVPAPGSAYAFDEAPALPPVEALAPQPAPFQPGVPQTPPVDPNAPPPAANPGQFQIPGQS